MDRRATPLALAWLACAACASAPKEAPPRPVNTRPPSFAPPPDTAFRDDADIPPHAPSRAVPEPHGDRFRTRTLGSDAPRAARFQGRPVDLDVKGADIHDVMRLLSDVGRVNIVVAGEVQGRVTVTLRRVPWDQALDVVARAQGLAVEREGNVWLVRAARSK